MAVKESYQVPEAMLGGKLWHAMRAGDDRTEY